MKRGDGGGSEVFTTIAEVKDITGPGVALGTEDVSSHDSGAWREYIPTLKEGGEVTFDINYFSHTTQDNMWTDFDNRTKRNFQLVLPTSPAETWSFSAYVTSFEPSAPVEGALTAALTLQITGAITKA
jgi:predicted secreted protein